MQSGFPIFWVEKHIIYVFSFLASKFMKKGVRMYTRPGLCPHLCHFLFYYQLVRLAGPKPIWYFTYEGALPE